MGVTVITVQLSGYDRQTHKDLHRYLHRVKVFRQFIGMDDFNGF